MATLFRVYGPLPHYARQCYRRLPRGGWVQKQAFKTKEAAKWKLQPDCHVYECVYHGWHIGHARK